MSSTERLHTLLDIAFKHFNKTLFDQSLPKIWFSEHQEKGMMAYFSPDRWTSSGGEKHHEIALNLDFICRASLLEIMQLLVHEMVHCWQYEFGKTKDKHHAIYHNQEWSKKMIQLGLIPTSTGKPGGKKTGEHMSDYPKTGGLFIKSCLELLNHKKFSVPWHDRVETLKPIKHIEPHIKKLFKGMNEAEVQVLASSMNSLLGGRLLPSKKQTPSKTKYVCPSCSIHVWGKPNLKLLCNDCDELMIVDVKPN